MRISFLHQPNDPYTIVRIKYFLSKGHTVYSITFPVKSKKKQIRIDGLTNIELPDIFLNRIFLLKRLVYIWHIYNNTNKLNLDILHVVNAESIILATFSASKKTVLENQGSDVLLVPQNFFWIKYIYRYFYKYMDAVIQDSKIAQEAGLEYGAPEKNNKVIEIGIDFSIFNDKIKKGIVRKKLGLINNEPIVFSSRGIGSIYNIDIIIKSIPLVKRHFTNIKYIFTSTYGNLSDEMKQFININNLYDNVIFTGWLNHEKEIPFYYRDVNVVVSVPSYDSSPFSVYEAMATMTPVIVSDLPWLNAKFTPGKHLITVPVRDKNILAVEIINILNGNTVVNLKSAFNIVYEKINMMDENAYLEHLYNSLL